MKKLVPIILLQLAIITCSAQGEVYYFGPDNGEVTYENEAKYKKEITKRKKNVIHLKSYLKENDKWKQEKIDKIRKNFDGAMEIKSIGSNLFADNTKRNFTYGPEGKIFFKDHAKGKLVRSGTTTRELPLMLQDTIKLYYQNGNLKSVALYDQNRLIENQNWLKNGSQYIENIHYFVDDTPEHSQGQLFFKQYMLAGIRDTEIDLTQISDLVIVGMVIREDGKLDGLHVKKGIVRELNSAIIDLLAEMPGNWVPARLNDKPVNYYMELPFNFQHNEEGFDMVDFSSGFLIWD